MELDETMITLFDMASTMPRQAFSAAAWKTRYALNFKNLQFKTHWLEPVEIQAFLKQLGARPTMHANDTAIYTIPVIYDPKTKRCVSESFDIAEYLDETYPHEPKLMQSGVKDFDHAFSKEMFTLYPFVIPPSIKIVREPSKAYFRATREAFLQKPLEDAIPKGEERATEWAKLKKAFTGFAGWSDDKVDNSREPGSESDGKNKWVLGNTPSYADLIVSAHLMWIIRVLGEDSPEWVDLKQWDGGRWGRLLEEFRIYEGTD
ncbi:hypothetical protein FA15DRAFT_673589 [Coprinopsis marcescibilis]|uniref:GST N-terminal domain-containing protein n=1 Tax=Coprinopsis marcescibilis TaxID=230819 RepID=A0A5C3KJ82_COPMA|nr:hypothetical protein FA15DRAFT_673589 [Coprinopsis marcescibilis]